MKVLRLLCAVVGLVMVASGVAGDAGTATRPTPRAGEMNARFINVGQGSSLLPEFSCGAALIDTGGEKNDSFGGPAVHRTYLDSFFQRRRDLGSRLVMVIIFHCTSITRLGCLWNWASTM
jgi:hypothetical protein